MNDEWGRERCESDGLTSRVVCGSVRVTFVLKKG